MVQYMIFERQKNPQNKYYTSQKVIFSAKFLLNILKAAQLGT